MRALVAASIWGLVAALPTVLLHLMSSGWRPSERELILGYNAASWLAGTLGAFSVTRQLRPERSWWAWIGTWFGAGALAFVWSVIFGTIFVTFAGGRQGLFVAGLSTLSSGAIALTFGVLSVPPLSLYRHVLRRRGGQGTLVTCEAAHQVPLAVEATADLAREQAGRGRIRRYQKWAASHGYSIGLAVPTVAILVLVLWAFWTAFSPTRTQPTPTDDRGPREIVYSERDRALEEGHPYPDPWPDFTVIIWTQRGISEEDVPRVIDEFISDDKAIWREEVESPVPGTRATLRKPPPGPGLDFFGWILNVYQQKRSCVVHVQAMGEPSREKDPLGPLAQQLIQKALADAPCPDLSDRRWGEASWHSWPPPDRPIQQSEPVLWPDRFPDSPPLPEIREVLHKPQVWIIASPRVGEEGGRQLRDRWVDMAVKQGAVEAAKPDEDSRAVFRIQDVDQQQMVRYDAYKVKGACLVQVTIFGLAGGESDPRVPQNEQYLRDAFEKDSCALPATLIPTATSTSVAPIAPTLESTPVEPRPTASRVPIPLPVQSHIGDSEAIALLERYLAASYDPAVGLYREAPNVAPTTYWVYSDGYLGGLDISKWNVPVLTKWTVLVDKAVVPEETFTYRHRDIDLGEGVRSEAHDTDPPRLNDWQEYADRVLLAAINARNAQDRQREAELMKIADAMWNGKGMADKFHRVQGYYQTYHVALYYFMTGNLKAREVLLRLQERDPKSNRYGGIYTEYGKDGRPLPGTDTNIETTAIVLRALLRHATP